MTYGIKLTEVQFSKHLFAEPFVFTNSSSLGSCSVLMLSLKIPTLTVMGQEEESDVAEQRQRFPLICKWSDFGVIRTVVTVQSYLNGLRVCLNFKKA